MGFLDFLSAATPFAAEGVSNFREGQREGFEDRLAMADANLRRQREEQDRADRRRLMDAQIKNYASLAKGRVTGQQDDGESFGLQPVQVIGPDGQPQLVRFGNRGTRRVEEGLTLRPEPQAPRAPVRGTPEYLQAVRDEAEARARVAAETGQSSVRPTESQEKSFMFGNFMRESLPVIEQLGPRANGRKVSIAIGRGVELAEDLAGPGAVSSDLLTPDEQQLVNAARMFAAGVLRKESGAAITPSELRDTFQRFIPLGNDSPQVIEQKRQNRELAARLMNDLSLPAERYYEQLRNIGSGGAPVPRGTPATPAAPPPDFEAWRASRRTP